MSASDLRRAVLLLNSYTGWGYAELVQMETDELAAWIDAARDLYRNVI